MPTPDRKPKPEAVEWNTELHAPLAVFDVHLVALQEIDRLVGNELTLDEDETTRLRRLVFAALTVDHARCDQHAESTPVVDCLFCDDRTAYRLWLRKSRAMLEVRGGATTNEH